MSKAIALALAVAAGLIGTYTLPASAQSPPTAAPDATPDVLQLRTGEVLHVRVTDVQPGIAMTVVLPDGSQRTIALSDIELAEGPGLSFPNPTLAPPSVPATTPLAPVSVPATSPVPSDDLRDPGPGRVPLVIESAGHPMAVGESFGTQTLGGGWGRGRMVAGRELCTTPCTLYVHPGLFSLLAAGPGILRHEVRLDVPASGMQVVARAPRAGRMIAMLLLGALADGVMVGGIELVVFGHADPGLTDAGVALLVMGAGGMLTDYIGFGVGLRGGLVDSRPLPVSMGAAPVPGGGGALSASLRF